MINKLTFVLMLVIIVIVYRLKYERVYRKGQMDQWLMERMTALTIWHGTGEDDPNGFNGLNDLIKDIQE